MNEILKKYVTNISYSLSLSRYDFELFNYSATSYFNIAKSKELDMPEESAVLLGKPLT